MTTTCSTRPARCRSPTSSPPRAPDRAGGCSPDCWSRSSRSAAACGGHRVRPLRTCPAGRGTSPCSRGPWSSTASRPSRGAGAGTSSCAPRTSTISTRTPTGSSSVGYMGNTVLPARGGEVLRIFLLSERSHRPTPRDRSARSCPSGCSTSARSWCCSRAHDPGRAGAAGRAGGRPYIALRRRGAAARGAGVGYLRLRVAGRCSTFAERVRPVARASRLLLTRPGVAAGAASLVRVGSEGGVFWLCVESLAISISVLDATARRRPRQLLRR